MSQYCLELQRYFEAKCDAFYVAYIRAKQLIEKKDRTTKEKFEFADWTRRVKIEKEEIEKVIEDFKAREMPIIVTKKSEVVALISFFGKHPVDKWDILYQNGQYLRAFPKDQLSQDFLEAYLRKDQKKMMNLLKYAYKL